MFISKCFFFFFPMEKKYRKNYVKYNFVLWGVSIYLAIILYQNCNEL